MSDPPVACGRRGGLQRPWDLRGFRVNTMRCYEFCGWCVLEGLKFCVPVFFFVFEEWNIHDRRAEKCLHASGIKWVDIDKIFVCAGGRGFLQKVTICKDFITVCKYLPKNAL